VGANQRGVRVIRWNARFAIVALLLGTTALFLQARARRQVVPSRTALASFPVELKNWVSSDIPIATEDLQTLGPGDYLQRRYSNRSAPADVDLYIAYHANQTAFYHHLPQDCLISSGWSTVESGVTTLALPGNSPFSANRYLIARGNDRQMVLFWYSAHGRRMASENHTDLYLVLNSLRLNRNDYALVRINTGLRSGEEPGDAERRLLAFAGTVNSSLSSYIPD
jgi:EpsI family protein